VQRRENGIHDAIRGARRTDELYQGDSPVTEARIVKRGAAASAKRSTRLKDLHGHWTWTTPPAIAPCILPFVYVK